MNALQQFKQKGRTLRSHLATTLGSEVTLSQAYEALAAMEGASSWNEFSARLLAAPATPASTGLVLDTQLGLPAYAGTLAKVCALIRQDAKMRHSCSDYRPTVQSDVEEALAAFNVVATGEDCTFAQEALDAVRRALAVRTRPLPEGSNELQALEVNMTDVFEYLAPEELPEWQWIAANGAFAHRDNNREGGVWEFMVHHSKAEDDTVPDALKPFFDAADRVGAAWVMFHQG